MGFSSSNTMTRRRDGSMTNSTKTCRLDSMGSRGYSYNELILLKVNGMTICNSTLFSNTTSKHQRTLFHWKTVTNRLHVYLSSMNDIERAIESKKLDAYFTENWIFSVSSTADATKILSNLKYSRKKIVAFQKAVFDGFQDHVKIKKKQNSERRLLNNIECLNYSTEKGLEKAIDKAWSLKLFYPNFRHSDASNEKFHWLISILLRTKDKKMKETFLANNVFLKNELDRKQKLSVFGEIGA